MAEPAIKLVDIDEEHIDAVLKLTKDLRTAAESMGDQEARYLVDLYYQVQEQRKAAFNQVRSMAEEPHAVLLYVAEQSKTVEGQIRTALDLWTREFPPSKWARAQRGIGPVIAAGLRAHIDITKAPTVGHIWRFAGLDPTSQWNKGEKRPWNASLKVLCWKIGESFVKVKGTEDWNYGHLYDQRKAYEQQKNEAGEYADQAAHILETKRIGQTTEAFKWYTQGKLPPGHIHARAKRWAVKLFLAHYHAVLYRNHFGQEPPKPYVMEHLGHVHLIPVP